MAEFRTSKEKKKRKKRIGQATLRGRNKWNGLYTSDEILSDENNNVDMRQMNVVLGVFWGVKIRPLLEAKEGRVLSS